MRHSITGTTMPVLQIQLDPDELLIAEPGEFSWMTENIELNTTTKTGATGFLGALGRAFAGGGLFMTEYAARGGPGMVAFAAKVPGTIHQLDVAAGESYMIHKRGFLCGSAGAQLSIGFQSDLDAGLFGGNGFVMQRLTGPCSAFVELGGESIVYDLPVGHSMMVHPGHVGIFEESVRFDITRIGGFRNVNFGANDIFIAQLTGPGRVWLQSMTLPDLAHALSPYLVSENVASKEERTAVGVVAESFLGEIFER